MTVLEMLNTLVWMKGAQRADNRVRQDACKVCMISHEGEALPEACPMVD